MFGTPDRAIIVTPRKRTPPLLRLIASLRRSIDGEPRPVQAPFVRGAAASSIVAAEATRHVDRISKPAIQTA